MTISLHPDTPQGRSEARSEGHAMATSPATGAVRPKAALAGHARNRLFIKYVALFVAVVAVALLSNGIFEVICY